MENFIPKISVNLIHKDCFLLFFSPFTSQLTQQTFTNLRNRNRRRITNKTKNFTWKLRIH